MARQINLDEPLSEADVVYMQQRPWLEEQAIRLGYDLEELYSSATSPADDDDGLSDLDPEDLDDGDEDEGDEGDDEEDEEDEQVVDYSEWSRADLAEELKRRDLSATGKKDELIQRLVESDSAEEENED